MPDDDENLIWGGPGGEAASMTDEVKVQTVHNFHDQLMSAVLDGREIVFFDLVEAFFQRTAKKNYQAGYVNGWAAAVEVARRLSEEGSF